jgi:hypothetical protein
MYSITLNKDDRQAIDWIGGRYSHGSDLRCILESEDVKASPDEPWESDQEITFYLPEYKAWELKEIVEEGNLDCINLGSNLAQQLTNLVLSIV